MEEKLNEFGKKIKAVSAELATEIKTVASKVGLNIEDALKEIYAIYNEEELSVLEDEQSRILTAVRVFKYRQMQKMLSTAVPYKLYVLDKTGVSKFTEKSTGRERSVARVFGIAKPDVPDAPGKYMVASVTLFDNKAELAKNIVRKKTYRAALSGSVKSGILTLYSDETTAFSEIPTEKMGDVEQIIKEVFPLKTVAELRALPHGASVYVRASVINTKTGVSTNRNWGLYVVSDDSISIDEFRTTGGLSVFLDAEQVRYASGSEIGIVGTVQKAEDGSFSFRGLFVNPILVFEIQPQMQVQPATPASVEGKKSGIEDLMDDSEIF